MVPTNTAIPTGLSIDSQVPLNTKEYFRLESDIIDLGVDDELAYNYYKGMPAYCAETNIFYIWREVIGVEVGLRPSNFIYPDGWTAEGIDYSNKVYNFFINSSTDQNNFVRFIVINPADLPNNYTEQDVCNYILALPPEQRTIAETDSKWNILIANQIE